MKSSITTTLKRALLPNPEDPEFKIRRSLYTALALNIAYSAFQLALGIYYSGIWYYAMSGYYVILALIRLFLTDNPKKSKQQKYKANENLKYGITGVVLLLMNISLALMVFIAISDEQNFARGKISSIALAAYTFTSLTLAIIGNVKYRKNRSLVFSAAKIISLSAALVSMLSLEATMLRTFGTPEDEEFSGLMIGLFGAAIFIFITFMAIYMIVSAHKKARQEKVQENIREYPE